MTSRGKRGSPGQPGKPGGQGGTGGRGGEGGAGIPRGPGGVGGEGGQGGDGGHGDSVAEHWAGTARLLAACTAVCALIAIVIGLGSLRVADRVEANSTALAKLEHHDNLLARKAYFRQCSRNNLDRAEVHLRAQLLPPGRARAILKQLGLPPSSAEQYSLVTAERRLPILNCRPNLRGAAPTVLSQAAQRQYVQGYLAGLFDPVTGERR